MTMPGRLGKVGGDLSETGQPQVTPGNSQQPWEVRTVPCFQRSRLRLRGKGLCLKPTARVGGDLAWAPAPQRHGTGGRAVLTAPLTALKCRHWTWLLLLGDALHTLLYNWGVVDSDNYAVWPPHGNRSLEECQTFSPRTSPGRGRVGQKAWSRPGLD